MKLDKRIKTYNKKYQKELEDALRIIEPYLIQAFTSFYGEEYYRQIAYVVQNMKYTYFLSKNFFKSFQNLNYGLSAKDQRVIQTYLKYLANISLNGNRIKDENALEEYFLKKLIVFSSFEQDRLVYADFLSLIEQDVPIYTYVVSENEFLMDKAIFLPIFVLDLKVIIHELNHALAIDVVGFTDDELITPTLFLNEECEELFNDYIAEQIVLEYMKIKGPIPKGLHRFHIVNAYESFYYLIEIFYYVFEQVIKRCIMNKNFNMLREYAGKEDFCLFCSLVQKYYLQGGCSEEQFNELNNLVLKMNEHAFTIENYDYENLFQKLESMGYRVRRLK